MSSGILWNSPASELLREYVVGLTDAGRPKVCFIPTATGDSADLIVSFYNAFPADRYVPSHLQLFHRTVEDLRTFVLAQDVIYVGGGNTVNMLAVWREHGLDSILHEAWERGIVLCGSSAGGLCWFDGGITDSFGPQLAAVESCLGFLPGTFCPHYDSEERRRSVYQRSVTEGLAPGWACEDGTALHFEGRDLKEGVSASPGASVYRVENVEGEVQETPLVLRHLW